MKLKATFERELDVELPVFFREDFLGTSKIMAVINDCTMIVIRRIDNPKNPYISIVNKLPAGEDSEIVEAIKTWKGISEEEFLHEHETAISSLSLSPKLIEKTESANDLEGLAVFETGGGSPGEPSSRNTM